MMGMFSKWKGDAQCGQPSDSNFRACGTSAHQMPEADAVVALGTAPCREEGQAVVKGDGTAVNIPRHGSIGGARASLRCVRIQVT